MNGQRKDKIKANIQLMVGKCLFGVLSIFPIKRKVVFSNFIGKHYDDNPRYISEALHKVAPDIKIVWLKHKGFQFNVPDYVKVVEYPSFRMLFEMATSRVWVDSHTKAMYIMKRRGQYYLQTWHGGLGMKKIEGDAEDSVSYYYMASSKHDIDMADALVSNSEWISNIYKRAFHYKGEILKSGYPKNDIIIAGISEDEKDRVKEELGIDRREKIFLYAPTFRKNYGPDKWMDIDLQKVYSNLNSGSEKWAVLVRQHPSTQNDFGPFNYGEDIIDATYFPRMQDLILSTDIYVTDYSSGIFDFMLLRKPGFIYASDYELYEKDERGLYFGLDALPFPHASTTDELINEMSKFNNQIYQAKINSFIEEMGLYEPGNASEHLAILLADYLNKKQKG